MSAWPRPALEAVPAPDAAAALAGDVRRLVEVAPAERCSLARVYAAADVELRVAPLRCGARAHEAMLLPQRRDRFRVVVDPAVHAASQRSAVGRRKARFRLAHELAHTFFYHRDDELPQRASEPSGREEGFCHRFAGELLVPRAATDGVPLTPDGLRRLADAFDVSAQVAAVAIAHARPGLEIVFLRWAEHPRGGRPAMRVEWGVSPRFVARGESFKSSLAGLAKGEHGRCVEELQLAGRRQRTRVSAFGFGGSMMAFLERLDEEPAAAPAYGQLSLLAPPPSSAA